jgi:hypothetical protein
MRSIGASAARHPHHSLPLAFALGAAVGIPMSAGAQAPLWTVRGVVHDTAGAPLEGAQVVLGRRPATTNAQGVFSVDSIRPGNYTIMIRRVGYTPIHGRVDITPRPADLEYALVPAPLLLPTIDVEGRRTGIYGVVSDPSHHAAVGARVQVLGARGGEALTDSLGRFAFPAADRGVYMVRFTFPGYRERRLTVELKRGEGRELAIQLMPSLDPPFRGDEWALKDLRLRLAMGLRRERFTAAQLERYGSGSLCTVPLEGVRLFPFIIVNGTNLYRNMPREFLCFWRADEVELVEFGTDTCREASNSISYLVGAWCGNSRRSVPRGIMGGRRISTQGSGGSYVVIWEKK